MFGGRRRCAGEDVLFLVYPIFSRDYLVQELRDIIGEFPSWLVTTLQSLLIIHFLEEEILRFQFVTWIDVITWSECHLKSWVSLCYYKPLHC